MRINVAGDIATARKTRIARVNDLAAGLVAAHIPQGLESIYAERRAQSKGGRGSMVKNHAEMRGITEQAARVEMTNESDIIAAAIDRVDKQRQSAIVAINLALTVAGMDAIIEGMEA